MVTEAMALIGRVGAQKAAAQIGGVGAQDAVADGGRVEFKVSTCPNKRAGRLLIGLKPRSRLSR